METHELTAHPASLPARVTGVAARIVSLDAHWLELRWRIEAAHEVVIPPLAGRGRADGLWQTTCFELFVRPDGGKAYAEFNFSPSEQWAAYDFTGRREGMADRFVPRAPVCSWRKGGAFAIFDAALPVAALPALPASIAITAVIEEQGGVKSYWALAHGQDKPDFHDPACFAARLEAPRAS